MKLRTFLVATTFSVASAAAASHSALATTFTYDSISVVNNTGLYETGLPLTNGVLYSGSYGSPTSVQGFGSGELLLQNTSLGGTIAAWCLDISVTLADSGAYTIYNNYNHGLSSAQLGEIGALIHNATDAAIASNPDLSPATQLAIWDVVYSGTNDSTFANLSGPGVAFNSWTASVNTLAESLVSEFAGGTGSVYEFVARDNSSQLLVSAVPVPASLPLFGTALMGLAGLGWRRMRRSNAA